MSMPTSALAGPPGGDGENAQTLQQFVLQSARKRVHDLRRRGFGQPSKELEESVLDLITLLNSITLAVKKVGNRARSSGMPLPKEQLQKLNTFANNTWVEELLYSQKSCVILSEDMDEPVIVQKGTFQYIQSPTLLHPRPLPVRVNAY